MCVNTDKIDVECKQKVIKVTAYFDLIAAQKYMYMECTRCIILYCVCIKKGVLFRELFVWSKRFSPDVDDNTEQNFDKSLLEMGVANGAILSCDDFLQDYNVKIIVEHS